MQPNPVQVKEAVKLNAEHGSSYRLLVTSASGRLLAQKEDQISSGEVITYSPRQLGVQIVTLWIDGTKYTSTLVVQ